MELREFCLNSRTLARQNETAGGILSDIAGG
jgi:hypothetical protein